MMTIRDFLKNLITSNNTSIFIGIFCLFLIGYLQFNKLNDNDRDKTDYKKQQEIEGFSLDILDNLQSFGFDNLMADWTMLKFLQYFGDGEARKQTGYSLSPKYLKAIVKHDPHFTQAYLIISPASSIFAGRPDQTVDLMNAGLEHLSPTIPNAYWVWLYKGVDEILFVGDIEAAKKSYTMAAEWAKIAGDAKIEKAARNTVQFLDKNPDSRQAQIGAWFMTWSNARDDYTRELAKRNIERLGGKLEIHPDGRVMAIPPKQG